MKSENKSDAITQKLSRAVGATKSKSSNEVESSAHTNGLGRVLITVYLILALAATLRAIFQIITKFDDAPIAYTLSLISGLVYIVATVALAGRNRVWTLIAWAALAFELLGVLIVGTLSIVIPEWFAHDSVWSYFGMNYFWIPLVLPVLGMWWLRQQARTKAPEAPVTSNESVY